MDRVVLETHCDVLLHDDEEVLMLAYLNSYFQTGLKNLLDRAILAHTEMHDHLQIPEHRLVDEIPFDFAQRLMSVVVQKPDGGHRLICKGAPEDGLRSQHPVRARFRDCAAGKSVGSLREVIAAVPGSPASTTCTFGRSPLA
jgi:magnesium-transporting ATPase (P-type)